MTNLKGNVASLLVAGLTYSIFNTAAAAAPAETVNCQFIRTAAQLQAIGLSATGTYCLANDIDLASVANFTPLSLPAGAKFFGNGFAIRNLKINVNDLQVGLFTNIVDATVQDLRLANVDIRAKANAAHVGALAGDVGDNTGLTNISNVQVDGTIRCTQACFAGGIVGMLLNGGVTIVDSTTSVTMIANNAAASVGYLGGAVGAVANAPSAVIRRVTSSGNLTCGAVACYLGGLIGFHSTGLVDRCSASGAITTSTVGVIGGLIGYVDNADATVRRSHASGPVSIGSANGWAGGLIGNLNAGNIMESYSVGPVSGGAMPGGLIGTISGVGTATDSYWDTTTSGQMTSGGGTGRTTAQLRATLPMGFGPAWGLTPHYSYPFLDDADLPFAPPLATLVRFNEVFTVLPIEQLERPQYKKNPAHENAASLAAVYVMIARAIGNTRGIDALRNAKIDTYWKDATQVATWTGAVTTHAKLGAFSALAPQTKLNSNNVLGQLKLQRLVILRGSYSKAGGGTAEHYLLATMFNAKVSGAINAVVANDPWTGEQVLIDPSSKAVLYPAGFPLKDFKVDGYRSVTLLNPT